MYYSWGYRMVPFSNRSALGLARNLRDARDARAIIINYIIIIIGLRLRAFGAQPPSEKSTFSVSGISSVTVRSLAPRETLPFPAAPFPAGGERRDKMIDGREGGAPEDGRAGIARAV